MSGEGEGRPPRGGFARMVPELHVTDVEASLDFWCNGLGFAIAYRRREERFAYLERPEGAQLMLCQRNGRFETGPMQRPFGQGVMLQIAVADIGPIVSALAARSWPLYMEPREIWRRTGDREAGQREFFVQDPDGYLVMLSHNLGERSVGA